jgi:hypothetical protein
MNGRALGIMDISRGIHNAKSMAKFIFTYCNVDPNEVMQKLEALEWFDVRDELSSLVQNSRVGNVANDNSKPDGLVLGAFAYSERQKRLDAKRPIQPPPIKCWKPTDGLVLHQHSTSYMTEEQRVYLSEDCLIVDEWQLGRNAPWEDERSMTIAPKHFKTLAAMLGVESIDPISLMHGIKAQCSGPDAFDRFKALAEENGLKFQEMRR